MLKRKIIVPVLMACIMMFPSTNIFASNVIPESTNIEATESTNDPTHIGGGPSHFYYNTGKTKSVKMSRNDLVVLKRKMRDNSNGLEKMKILIDGLSAPFSYGWIASVGSSVLQSPAADSLEAIEDLLDRQGNNFNISYDIYECEIPGRGYIIVDYNDSNVW